ncbi:RICIN domain-containing protein [Streptomyces californicus]|uniref:RICIN domain-containing protein n=1 Tax=Streptomyces TaxID=1883 RepID=UPI00211AB4A0|nr:RICIN domain-containing protein [Streptomyces sp. CB04723]
MTLRRFRGIRPLAVLAAGFASASLVLTGTGAAAVPAETASSLFPQSDAVRVLPGGVQMMAGGAIRNVNTGRCIDDSGAFGLREHPCNGLNYQDWKVIPQSGNWVLKNDNTGRCIDDSGAFGLREHPCNNLNYQRWELWRNGNGTITFKNENTGRCIDDSGAFGLREHPCNGLNYQQWYGQ